MDKTRVIAALLIMCGLIGLGSFIKTGIDDYAQKDRYVSVKGLAERDVPADKVVWPIQLKDAGNDLTGLYENMSGKTQKVIAFLKKNGIPESEILCRQRMCTTSKQNAMFLRMRNLFAIKFLR